MACSSDSNFRKSECFFVWGLTAQITPDLARRARDFFARHHSDRDGTAGFAFLKKSKTGIATPKAELDKIKRRLKEAEQASLEREQ